MHDIVSRINESHPGYHIYINDDNKIIAEKFHIGGKTRIGVFDTVDQLMIAFGKRLPSE